MVIWPREVMHATIDILIRVASTLCAELPDSPIVAMIVIKPLDQLRQRVAVGVCGKGASRTGRGNDYRWKSGMRVLESRSCQELTIICDIAKI